MPRRPATATVPWFPQAFRAAREHEGLTQEEIAGELHVTLRTIQHWEAGTKTPRLGVLFSRICPRFGWEWDLPFRVRDQQDPSTARYLGEPDWPMPDETLALAAATG